MSEDHGSWLSTAIAMFLPWSTLTFGVRAWAKIRTKNWGQDDYCISFALVAAVAHVAVTCNAIQHGYGRALSDVSKLDLGRVKSALYASQILYVVSVGLCRVSAGFFIAHMTYSGPQSKPAYLIAIFSALWTIISTFLVALRGNFEQPWNVMEGDEILYSRWVGIEATGLIIELALWALSINLVWGLQMKVKKRAFILCAFGARLGLIPIIVCRVLYLSPRETPDPTLTGIVPGILTQGAIHFSIMAGCITCLRPFLQTFNNPTYAVESRGTTTSGVSRGRDSYYKLETLKRVERSVVDSDDSANWRPFEGSREYAVAYPAKPHFGAKDKIAQRLDITSRHARKHSSKGLRDDLLVGDSDGTDRLIIQRTTEVSIQYEENTQR